jgi:hypothetical protein
VIQSYDFGTITINGKQYTSDCIVAQEYLETDWWRKEGHELCLDDIKNAIENIKPDAVVIGTGKYGAMKVLDETTEYLQTKNITTNIAKTDEAVNLYNALLETKNVAGFFHLTC